MDVAQSNRYNRNTYQYILNKNDFKSKESGKCLSHQSKQLIEGTGPGYNYKKNR